MSGWGPLGRSGGLDGRACAAATIVCTAAVQSVLCAHLRVCVGGAFSWRTLTSMGEGVKHVQIKIFKSMYAVVSALQFDIFRSAVSSALA